MSTFLILFKIAFRPIILQGFLENVVHKFSTNIYDVLLPRIKDGTKGNFAVYGIVREDRGEEEESSWRDEETR